MADLWLPGAYRDPGVNAGYNSGRSSMTRAVAHYTVGADSRGGGRDGYFNFLVHRDASRENGCTQYAEADAKTWHGYKEGYYDANSAGPGVEWERMVTGGINAEGLSDAEPLTDNQLAWGARLVAFYAEWGIPVELYNGPRYECGNYRGWINHQALDSDRSDGLLRAEWDAIAGGGTATPTTEEDDMCVWLCLEGGKWAGAWVQEGPYTLIQFQSVNDISPGRSARVSAALMEMIYNDVQQARDSAGLPADLGAR